MKPIACAVDDSAPLEASPERAQVRTGAVPRARAPGPGRRWRRSSTLLGIASVGIAVLASSSCTVTTDEFYPSSVEAEREPTVPGTNQPQEEEPASDPAAVTAPLGSAGEDADEATSANVPLEAGEPVGAGSSPPATPAEEADVPAVVEAPADAGPPALPTLTLPALSTLEGWASMPGRGVDTTTGGGDAPPVLARTADELVALAASPEPMTIVIQGTIEVPDLALASNKTLIGLDRDATLAGGLAIRGEEDAFVENVIVANLSIRAATSNVDGDALQVHYAHHVWVDHCALSDAADGLLDVVHGSDFVTVSHTRFFYTSAAPDPEHRFAVLVGHDITNVLEDRGHLNVTWHHDFWGEGVSRAMSGRFGHLHLFNNLFRSPGGQAVLSAGLESSWLVENNQFEDVAEPHTILLGAFATLAASGNIYVAAAGARDATATGFVPPYPYSIQSPFELAASIAAEAGPR